MKLKKILNEMMTDKDVAFKPKYGKTRNKLVKIDIFEKPTAEDLASTGVAEPRAVKTIDGIIYTVSGQDENVITHTDIVEMLSQKGYITRQYDNNWWKNKESLNSYVCIIRNKGRWVLAESYNLIDFVKSNEITWEGFKELVKSKYNNISTEYKE